MTQGQKVPFMFIKKISFSNFRCFSEEEVSIELEQDLTAFVGGNGCGKSAAIDGLRRLFGRTKDERTVVVEDFHLKSNESPQDICGRKMYIEVLFEFPELDGNLQRADETAPAFEPVIYAEDQSSHLRARMRLESVWDSNEYEDEVESKLYWLVGADNFGSGDDIDGKFIVAKHDRMVVRENLEFGKNSTLRIGNTF